MEMMIAIVGGLQEHQTTKTDGICPTLCSAMGIGGGNTPLVIEKTKSVQLGFMDNGTGKHQSNTVYDINALCPCISTLKDGGTQQIKVMIYESANGSQYSSVS